MKKPQITVAVGAGSGVLAMIGALLLLPHWLSSLPSTATVGDRLGYAAKWNALAAAPLFLAIIAVGNARFRSDAIDPTAGRETAAMLINSNMVDNTLQQYALF